MLQEGAPGICGAVEAVVLNWLAASSMALGRRPGCAIVFKRFDMFFTFFYDFSPEIIPCLWHCQVSLQVAVNMRRRHSLAAGRDRQHVMALSASALLARGVRAAQEQMRLGPPLGIVLVLRDPRRMPYVVCRLSIRCSCESMGRHGTS